MPDTLKLIITHPNFCIMKKIFILLSVLLLSVSAGYADVIDPHVINRCIDKTGVKVPCPKYESPKYEYEALIPFEQDKLTGFKDKSGNIVIEPKFDPNPFVGRYFFIDRYLPILKDKKFGLIDRQGNWVIYPQFDLLLPFSEGLAAACLNRKCGYIDKEGNWVIEPKFYAPMCYIEEPDGTYWFNYKCRAGSSRFSEGLAAVEYEKNKIGYINKQGELVIKNLKYDAGAFSEGLAAAVKEGSKQYGYIDKKGRYIIQPQFNSAGMFHNGYARVEVYLEDICRIQHPNPEISRKYNECNDRKAEKTKIKSRDCSGLTGDMLFAQYSEDGRLGFANQLSGELEIDYKFYRCDNPGFNPHFREELAAVSAERSGKCGYINTKGNWVIEPKYDSAMPFYNGTAQAGPCSGIDSSFSRINKNKKPAALFSAALLILVIIAAFSMRKLKK